MKYRVDYRVCYINGSIEVFADDEKQARDLVCNMNAAELIENTEEMDVEVETVEQRAL